MRKIIILILLLLLLSTLAIAGSSHSILTKNTSRDTNKFNYESNPISNNLYTYFNLYNQIFKLRQIKNDDNFLFIPEDIELKDDAFHGSDYLHFTEWWYFDAIFENGYSVQIGIRVMSLMNQGLIHLRLDIYNDGKLESNEFKTFIMWDFATSKDVPLVELNGNRIMDGHIKQDTGEWIYNLHIELDKSKTDLCFVGSTEGWKGSTPGGEWAVILPRAEVEGTIMFNDNTLNVSGIGYHDHNWDITLFTGINFGWYWGKVNSGNYTATWSKIMTTRFWGQPLLVINEKNSKYKNIEAENIDLEIKEFTIHQGMLIPYSFSLEAREGNISLHVDMEVFDIHHIRWAGIINYWRYHIQCTGFLTVGPKTESIDQVEIAEFIRFR